MARQPSRALMVSILWPYWWWPYWWPYWWWPYSGHEFIMEGASGWMARSMAIIGEKSPWHAMQLMHDYEDEPRWLHCMYIAIIACQRSRASGPEPRTPHPYTNDMRFAIIPSSTTPVPLIASVAFRRAPHITHNTTYIARTPYDDSCWTHVHAYSCMGDSRGFLVSAPGTATAVIWPRPLPGCHAFQIRARLAKGNRTC